MYVHGASQNRGLGFQGGRSVIINKKGGKSVILNNKGDRSVICRIVNPCRKPYFAECRDGWVVMSS